jgi:hypothetical protein
MNNLLYQYLIEAERHRNMLAESAHYRLVKQAKQQKIAHSKTRLRFAFSHLLEMWGRWLIDRSAMLAITDRKDLVNP